MCYAKSSSSDNNVDNFLLFFFIFINFDYFFMFFPTHTSYSASPHYYFKHTPAKGRSNKEPFGS